MPLVRRALFGKMYFLSNTRVDFPVWNSVNSVFMGFSENGKHLKYRRFLCYQKDNFLEIAYQKAMSFLLKTLYKARKYRNRI